MTPAPSASELAAARALETAGFENVRFLPVSRGGRTADILADRAGVSWAVEVRGATRPLRRDASFEPSDESRPLPYPTLLAYLALLWSEKRGQLEATRAAHGCAAGLLLVVVEGAPGPAWASTLADAWAAAGRPAGIVFALTAARGLLAYPGF